MEFIKLRKDRYLIKDSKGYVVSEKELKELLKGKRKIKCIKGCGCIIEKPKKEVENTDEPKTIEETATTTE